MKLAMRLPEGKAARTQDSDPRDSEPTEVIDLASRMSYPVVASRSGNRDALGLMAGIAFVALIGAATFWGLSISDDEATELADAGAVVPPQAIPAQGAAGVAVPVVPDEEPVPPQGDPAPAPVLANAPEAVPYVNPYASPTLVFDGGVAPAPAAANAAAAMAAAGIAPDATAVPGGGSAGEFAARIGGVGGGPATAIQNINTATTVTQGTMIPAILETAINTDVPGYVRAVVSQDVRSHDGSRVLIPRSSRLVGQYESGLQAGERRAYVIWQSLIRPDGVTVQLQSPATAFDGTAGLAGEVDTHFFGRFGSAILLSVIGGLTTIAGGGAQVILGGGQSAASTALQQDGTRPPTVRVRMGEPIRVYTARHLDFSAAPQVRTRR